MLRALSETFCYRNVVTYALFLLEPFYADADTLSDVAGLTGMAARDVGEVLRHGGRLSRALPRKEAEQLLKTLALLGVDTELRPTSPATAEPRRRLEPSAQTEPARPKLSPRPLIVTSILICIIGLLGVSQFRVTRAPAPGRLAPDAPVQLGTDGARPWLYDRHLVTPKARYSVEARVLALKRYRFGRGARLAPVDAALGWGPMSDSEFLEALNLKQRNRWYFVNWSSPAVSHQTVFQNSANTHLIPANAAIAKQIKRLKKHDVVQMTGYLVDVSAADGFYWRSSLSRFDSGDGSCELFWVEALSSDG